MGRRPRLTKLGLALLVIAAQAAAIALYRSVESERDRSAAPPPRYERLRARAPDVALTAADGSRTRLTDLRGTPVLLHFWATWCPPCKAELPDLLALGRKLRAAGGPRVIALSVDGDWSALRSFFGGQVPPEVMLDAGGGAAEDYGVSTLPDSYLLSADGALRLRLSGARDWRDRRLEALLRDEPATRE
jgi:thiol-disulfide isomerase/thioredoxin